MATPPHLPSGSTPTADAEAPGVRATAAEASGAAEAPAVNRRGRVLVIDDEPAVIASIRRILAAEHDVTSEMSGVAALGRLVAGERFDVVLCDLMMPDMTGMEFHAAVAGAVPDQLPRIVYLTGGAFTRPAQVFLGRITNSRLEKPFDVKSLRMLVRDRVARDPQR